MAKADIFMTNNSGRIRVQQENFFLPEIAFVHLISTFKQDQTLLWTCVAGANRQCVNSRYAKLK